MKKSAPSLILAFALGLSLRVAAQSVPGTINYQGRLTDNTPQQNPITATVEMKFAIYDAPGAGATLLWQEPAAPLTVPVTVTGGIFNVQLGGNGVPLPAMVFQGGTQRWLEISANGDILAPRQALSATGYANQAQNSASADSATVAITASNALALGGIAPLGYQLATAQSCGAGQFLNSIANGSAGCASAQSAITPPLALSAAITGAVFSATNSGTGMAGSFQINNSASSAIALQASSNGTGDVIYASTGGSGNGLSSFINGAGTAVYGYNSGVGAAGSFQTNNPANSANTLSAITMGTGRALFVNTVGTGTGAFVTVNNTANSSPALQGNTQGTGRAGLFTIANSGSAAAALSAVTNGTGTALHAQNTAAGDLLRGDNNAATVFRVDNSGFVTAAKYTGDGAGLTGLPDGGLSANVALLNRPVQAFSGANSFSNGANSFTGSGAGLTALNAANISSGNLDAARAPTGGNWSLAANLNIDAGNLAIDHANGRVGVGTPAPRDRLEVAGVDATVRITNINDVGGGFAGDSFSGFQLGMFNPTGAGWGAIPANSRRSLMGCDNTGRVGSLTNTFGSPLAFRNLLDDGSGNLDASGNVRGAGLVLKSGALKVTGAGVGTHTAAFIQIANPGNTSVNTWTIIDNNLLNGNPGAILTVTPAITSSTPPGCYRAALVFYNTATSRWLIAFTDLAGMLAGCQFNVIAAVP